MASGSSLRKTFPGDIIFIAVGTPMGEDGSADLSYIYGVIKMIAEVMKGRLRETDVLCRIGGEEFVVICRRADKMDAMGLAEDIRKTIEGQVTNTGKGTIKVTISIGIVTVTMDNIDTHAENMFKFADIALYHSKDNGRNRVTHYSDIA